MGLLSFLKSLFQNKPAVPASPIPQPLVASVCGHPVEPITQVKVFGEKISFELDPEKAKNVTHCPACLATMAVKCVKCGKAILIGEPIVLYSAKQKITRPEPVGKYEDQYVGCLRWDCAISGAFRSGFWIVPGQVKRVASPIEIAMATDKVAACSDISDPSQAIPLPKSN